MSEDMPKLINRFCHARGKSKKIPVLQTYCGLNIQIMYEKMRGNNAGFDIERI